MAPMKSRIESVSWIAPVAVVLIATSLLGQSVGTKDISVTSVEGESWIRHLHKPFNETSMGKTWDLGPAPPEPGEIVPSWQV
jgi:hypothetical protein